MKMKADSIGLCGPLEEKKRRGGGGGSMDRSSPRA